MKGVRGGVILQPFSSPFSAILLLTVETVTMSVRHGSRAAGHVANDDQLVGDGGETVESVSAEALGGAMRSRSVDTTTTAAVCAVVAGVFRGPPAPDISQSSGGA